MDAVKAIAGKRGRESSGSMDALVKSFKKLGTKRVKRVSLPAHRMVTRGQVRSEPMKQDKPVKKAASARPASPVKDNEAYQEKRAEILKEKLRKAGIDFEGKDLKKPSVRQELHKKIPSNKSTSKLTGVKKPASKKPASKKPASKSVNVRSVKSRAKTPAPKSSSKSSMSALVAKFSKMHIVKPRRNTHQ